MSRAYLRLDPAFYERKLAQGYSVAQIGTLAGVFCLAETQTQRGSFRSVFVLRALLGPGARHVSFLIERGDLILQDGGRLYVDGWREWQEGDVTVPERMRRLRSRKSVSPDTVPTVTNDTVGDVTARLAESGAVHSKAESGAPYRAPTNGKPRPEPERLPGEAIAPKHDGQHPDCFVCGTAKVAPSTKSPHGGEVGEAR